MPEHDQPNHEGLFPAGKRRTSKKLRLQSGYCEYKMKALLIKVGLCDAFVWSLNTNEVREVAAMANNLNKIQSLNDALRVVHMDKRDEHLSKTKHGDDGMRKGTKNVVTSDDFRTLKPP